MQNVLPLRVVGVLDAAERVRPAAGCECPGADLARSAWEDVVAGVERDLEALRLTEMQRRRGGLNRLSAEQREAVDRFTRDLLRQAVLERLRRLALARGRRPGTMREIREMFAFAR
jgi:hypothetical protein